MKKMILKTLTSFNTNLRNLTNHAPSLRGLLLIPLLMVCFALVPAAQAAPDGPAAPAAPLTPDAGPEIAPAAPVAPLAPLPGFNTADGANALANVTTGVGNSAFGWFSLFSDAEGSNNTAVGAATLLFNTANQNTAFGAASLLFNTIGTQNTAVGVSALLNNIDGIQNIAMGEQALNLNVSGFDNTAIGLLALLSNVDGSSNTAVGAAALRDNVSGSDNQAFGRGALRFNEGSGNIAIGREAGTITPLTGQYNNTILLGHLGDSDANDPDGRCYIGNIRDVTTGNLDAIAVVIDSTGQLGTVSSSRRFKQDIRPMDQTSEAILALKPVTFHYKGGDTKKAQETPQYGLIAEEVAAVNPDLIVRDKEGKIYSVRYDAVNVMLLNEFLKEHKKVEAQQATIAELKSTVAQQQKGMEILTAQLKEQAAQIQKVSAQLEVGKPAPQVANNQQ